MEVVKTTVGFTTNQPIVDVEISNNPRNLQGKLDPNKGNICVAGFLVDNTMSQFLLKHDSQKQAFKEAVAEFLASIANKKLHAFYIDMEQGCFTNLLGWSPRLHEVKPPIKGRGTTKDNFFTYLTKTDKVLPEELGFTDPLHGRGELCPEYWKNGRYEDVRQHNVCCLTKEAKILEHKEFIMEQLTEHINENGWLSQDFSSLL